MPKPTVFDDPEWVRRLIADRLTIQKLRNRLMTQWEEAHLPLLPEHRAQGGACQANGECRWCEA